MGTQWDGVEEEVSENGEYLSTWWGAPDYTAQCINRKWDATLKVSAVNMGCQTCEQWVNSKKEKDNYLKAQKPWLMFFCVCTPKDNA